MKAEYINPFVESVTELFSSMLGGEATRGKVGLVQENVLSDEITALIGLSGPARGTVALGLSESTALAIVSTLLGEELTEFDETIVDGVAEVVNILAGSAKAKFPNSGSVPLDLSLPTVVQGSNYNVLHPSKAVWLDIPFASHLGSFNLRVTFESQFPQGGAN